MDPPYRVLGVVLIYRDRIAVSDTPDTARECNNAELIGWVPARPAAGPHSNEVKRNTR